MNVLYFRSVQSKFTTAVNRTIIDSINVFCDIFRSILEAKAKLYEKMTTEALHHDEQEHPVLSQSLVNFTQKAIENLQEVRKASAAVGSSSASTTFEEDESVNPLFPVDEEEWTEFTDGLGRTRRCLKSDLSYFISRDDALVRPTNPASLSLCREAEAQSAEMKRQKWEQDMAETSAKEKVHYQDVLYDGKEKDYTTHFFRLTFFLPSRFHYFSLQKFLPPGRVCPPSSFLRLTTCALLLWTTNVKFC